MEQGTVIRALDRNKFSEGGIAEVICVLAPGAWANRKFRSTEAQMSGTTKQGIRFTSKGKKLTAFETLHKSFAAS
jgi:hypothetical protein